MAAASPVVNTHMICTILQQQGSKNICSFTSRTTNKRLRNKIEWSNILAPIANRHVNFLDPTNNWFLDPTWNSFIKEHTQQYHFDLCIGTSMGAFGALLYSEVINADHYILFAPQAFVNKQRWDRIGEKHRLWSQCLSEHHNYQFLTKSSQNISMVYSRYHEDQEHIEQFTRLGYTVEYVETENHTVAYALAEQNMLLDFVLSKCKME